MNCYSNCPLGGVEDDKMIECDLCKLWVHKPCAAEYDETYKMVLKALKKQKVPFWRCKLCVDLWNNLKQATGPLNQSNNQTNKKLAIEIAAIRDEFKTVLAEFTSEKEVLLEVIRVKEKEIAALEQLLASFTRKIDSIPTAPSTNIHTKERKNTLVNAQPRLGPLNVDTISAVNTSFQSKESSPRRTRSKKKKHTAPTETTSQTEAEAEPVTVNRAAIPTPSTTVDQDTGARREADSLRTQSASPSWLRTGTSHFPRQRVRSSTSEHPEPIETRNKGPFPIKSKFTRPILVIGSSLTRGLLQEMDPKAEVCCFPGITTEQLARKISLTQLPPGARGPDTVILHVGGNNLSNGQHLDDALGDHWYLVSQAKAAFPQSRIIVSGILHRRQLPKHIVKRMNFSLKWLCKCNGTTFVDFSSAISGRMYKNDGVHLNPYGTATLSKLFRNFCEAILSPSRHLQPEGQPSIS